MTGAPIRTARLTLRAGRPKDLDPLHRIFTDPRAMRYWDRPPHDDIAQTSRFLDRFIHADPAHREEYILDLDGTCIGKAGMWKPHEVGFILHPEHWRKGYAREAMEAILPRIDARFPDAGPLTAEIDPRNTASAALLTRLGFTLDRVTEKDFLYGGWEWCDTAHYLRPVPPVR